MNTQEFLNTVAQHKIVPVFYHADATVVMQTVAAAYRGGVRVFEFVNRGENALETFKTLVKELHNFPDLTLGIGTIYTAQTANLFIEAGAQFVVSPCFVEEVANLCKNQDIIYLPGISTITEAFTASQSGCKVVKIFPASVIGSAFAKALKSVLPQLHMMPTGGIEPSKAGMEEWIKAGAICIGMGSQLFDTSKMEAHNFNNLSEDIARAVTTIATVTEDLKLKS